MSVKRYKSFYEMLKGISKHFSIVKYYLSVGFDDNVEAYQDICRIYLDEYPNNTQRFSVLNPPHGYGCDEMADGIKYFISSIF